MKRFVCGMLIFITVLILIACGGTDQEMTISENTDTSKTDNAKIADASENYDMLIENKADTENQNSITNFTVESAKGCRSDSRFQQSRSHSGKYGIV